MEYWAAITLGIVSSFHCVGMCGPIAFALPLNRKNIWTKSVGAFLYNLGRILTYASLGGLFGLFGKALFTAGFQRGLSIGIGSLFLLSVLIPVFSGKGYNLEGVVAKHIGKLKYQLGKQFKKSSNVSLLTIGVLNGLLPCGMVYLGLAAAVGEATLGRGALFMVFFGLGTFPLMYLSSIVGDYISVSFRTKIRKAVPVLVGIMGLLFILRGLNLDIPYVSPVISKIQPGITQCD